MLTDSRKKHNIIIRDDFGGRFASDNDPSGSYILTFFFNLSRYSLDSLDVDLYGDLLAVDLNQEMTYPEVTKQKAVSLYLLLSLLNLYML